MTDLASAHRLALHHPEAGRGSGFFNLGNAQGTFVLEAVELAPACGILKGNEVLAGAGPYGSEKKLFVFVLKNVNVYWLFVLKNV